MSIEKTSFGFVDGKEAKLYTLKNTNGFQVDITNFGGSLVNIFAKDKNGNPVDVCLGYGDAEGYKNGGANFGALIGRYANRICKGKFVLNGKEYNLFINNGENHLHGGKVGYNKVMWEVVAEGGGDEPWLLLKFTDVAMRENYPGTLTVNVKYTITADDSIKIEYYANTDETTYVNLTNHCYFNLNGQGNGDILGHGMRIFADCFTPTNAGLIPTGEIASVEGTAMDFRTEKTIGRDIESGEEPLVLANGYDHNYVLGKSGVMKHAATATGNITGIKMDVYTDKPGVQLYVGNFLKGNEIGKDGKPYEKRTGFCLETQFYPDSPNHPEFPSCKLTPDETYHFTTIYKFSV